MCIGTLSIIESCNLKFVISSLLIAICLLLDVLDGFIARLLNVESEYGKQLDSFSDLVAFGLAPGVLMYNFINFSLNEISLAYVAMLIPIFSSLRLSKYNLEAKKNKFNGITTPVSAILFISLPLINNYEKNEKIISFFINPQTICIMIIIISYLLICSFETFSIRIEAIKNDKRKLTFMFICLSILYIFKFSGLPMVVLIYIILSKFKIIN